MNYTGDYSKEWNTDQCRIIQSDFDYDLKVFDIYVGYNRDTYIGSIVPSTIEDMQEMIKSLNNGACPIYECWDDGLGNTVNSLGFNEFQIDF